jgi:hypothetical protein
MRESFRGWYKPLPAERETLWANGTVALDASALLSPYRVSVDVQRRLFDALEANRSRLWCPYQAAREYQEHRLGVIREQLSVYDEIRKKLATAEATLLQTRSEHPAIDRDAFQEQVKRALGSIGRFIDDVAKTHPPVLEDDPDRDTVRDKWDALLEDRIGDPLQIDEQWRRRADERYEEKIPPGFLDQKKDGPARKYGDLIIWFELLNKVRQESQTAESAIPVLFITEDKKSDWWREVEGERHGPDPRLVEEMGEAGGAPFWMYTIESYLHEATERFGWEPLGAGGSTGSAGDGLRASVEGATPPGDASPGTVALQADELSGER